MAPEAPTLRGVFLALLLSGSAAAQSSDEPPERLPVEVGRTPVELPKLPVDRAPNPAREADSAGDVRGFTLDEDGVPVITVWGRQEMAFARDEVVRGLKAEGWTVRDRDGDRWVFDGPERWMGRVYLDPDGSLTFKRNYVLFSGAGVESTADYSTYSSIDRDPQLVSVVGDGALDQGLADASEVGQTRSVFMPEVKFSLPAGKNKLDKVHMTLLDNIGDDLAWYRAVRDETLHREYLQTLQQRLDQLWEQGVPMFSGAPLDTAEERKQAALEYWATRPRDPHGDEAAQRTGVWLAETLRGTSYALTAEEAAAWNAKRPEGPKLVVE